MKKMKITIAYFVILSFVAVISVTKAEAFDPEAISQVSKGIAEWKLMNEGKSETQLEPKVYVSSSLSGMVERGNNGKVGVIKGLSGLIEMNQLPDPILWNDASKLNTLYNGNIEIIIDRTLDRPGYTRTILQGSGNQTCGKSVISINPEKFKEWGTDSGGVLAHEMQHAKEHFYLLKLNLPQYGPIEISRTSLHLQETKALLGKASHIHPAEWHAIDADNNYRATLQAKFGTENSVARSIGIKNYDPLKTYKISDAQALGNIPKIKGNSTIGKSLQYSDPYAKMPTVTSLPSTQIGGGMRNISALPPPGILFSMPKTLTYSPYSMPKMPTYTTIGIPKTSYSVPRIK